MFSRFLGNQILKWSTKGAVHHPNRMQAMVRLPVLLRVSYALFRDDRVPLWQRGAVLGLIALILSPLDLPGDVPVLGQFWNFTLAVTVLEVFINQAPALVVNEHITRLGLEKKVPLRRV